ncbi:hypothetical protein BC938DRAFT_476220 [Jimgerdemannia flammicorona]|uniref:Uncharacterized protein n=1 Tax=Jimgerdemannia flammicorona TaxID=994334 RepID=A0A433QQU8_9FUNG|nr:hypothetical protein BC938DRAFT_476220 [Jimgerdemannia flammicorona]
MTHNDNPTWSPIDTPKPVLPDVSIPSTRRHSEIFPITIPDHLSNLPTSAVSAHAHSHRKSWSSATIPLEHFHHLNGFTSSLPAIVSTGSPPDNAPPRAETVEEKHSRLIKEHIPDFDLEDIGTRTVGPLAPGLENWKLSGPKARRAVSRIPHLRGRQAGLLRIAQQPQGPARVPKLHVHQGNISVHALFEIIDATRIASDLSPSTSFWLRATLIVNPVPGRHHLLRLHVLHPQGEVHRRHISPRCTDPRRQLVRRLVQFHEGGIRYLY